MNSKSKLSDIRGLSFIGGQITSRIESDERKGDPVIGKIKVIPPKAIKEGKIDHDELYELEYKTEFDEKKLTKEGDIVVKLSTPYDSACITDADEGLLITSYCIIIRNTGDAILSDYLAAFCNSECYRRQVMNMVSGATIPMLTIGKVKEAQMSLPTMDEQRQIADYSRNISEKESVMKRIILLEREKLEVILGGE